MESIVICGRGPSATMKAWDFDTDVMAVSSGYQVAGDITHFCALDRPFHFPKWLQDTENFQKHVPVDEMGRQWDKLPNVRVWPYDIGDHPDFLSPDTPCVQGETRYQNHSLLFAVQVASKLGYRRLVFLGVDLTEEHLYEIDDIMQRWYPIAQKQGIAWENASPLSMLDAWMPPCTTEEALVLA